MKINFLKYFVSQRFNIPLIALSFRSTTRRAKVNEVIPLAPESKRWMPVTLQRDGMTKTSLVAMRMVIVFLLLETVTAFAGGLISITNLPPSIIISETIVVNASGGVQPYKWISTNTSVAMIDSATGSLIGKSRGMTAIKVVDANGDSAVQQLNVADFRVVFGSTSFTVTDTVVVPIIVTNLSGLGIFSSDIRIQYDTTAVRFVSFDKETTLTSSTAPAVKDSGGEIRLAIASATPFSGGGKFIKLKFKAAPNVFPPAFSPLVFIKFQPNEPGPTTPIPLLMNGGLNITPKPNTLPKFSFTPNDTTIKELDSLVLKFLATDPDGDSVRYVIDPVLPIPPGLFLDKFTGTLSWRPQLNQQGIYPTVVKVLDGRGGEIIASVKITVLNLNQKPNFTGFFPDTLFVNENQLRKQTIAASDFDFDSLTFSLQNAPSGMTILPLNQNANTYFAELSWQPNFLQAGIYQIGIIVSDPQGGSSSKNIVVKVFNVNRPPQFTKTLPDTVFMLDTMKLIFSYQGFDPDGDLMTFSKLVGPANSTITSNGIFSFNPFPNQIGKFPISIQLSDGNSTVVRNALIAVVQSNNSPKFTVTLPDTTITINQKFSFQYTAADFDINDTLKFGLLSGPQGATVSLTGVLEWTPTSAQLGSAIIVVGVTDGKGGSLDTAIITVTKINRPPQFTKTLPDTSFMLDTMKLIFTYQGFDPDGDPMTFSKLAGPANSDISVNGDFSFTPQPNQIGTFPISIQLSDGNSTVIHNALIVVVQSSNSPKFTATLPDTTIPINQKFSFQFMAIDPNNDPLFFVKVVAPSGATVSPLGLLEWTPTSAQLGTALFVVGVTDGKGGALDTAFVTVAKFNKPPQFQTVLSDTTIKINKKFTFQYSAFDPDGDPLTFGIISSPQGATMIAAGLLEWTPTVIQERALFVIQVSDGKSFVFDSAFVSVAQLNNAPLFATVLPDSNVEVSKKISFHYKAFDADNDNLSFSIINPPANATLTTDGLFEWTPNVSQLGKASIVVKVSDSFTTVSDTAVLNVINNPPVFTKVLSDTTISENQTLTFSYGASDVNGDPLKYNLVTQIQGLTLTSTGQLSWIPSFTQAGIYTIIVSVSDNLSVVNDTVKVIVLNTNRAPVFTAIQSDRTLSVDSTVLFTYKVDDPDGESVRFSLKKGPASAKISLDGVFEWKAVAKDIGKDTIIISANDGTVSVHDTAVVTVFGYPIAKILDSSAINFGTLSVGETKRLSRIVKNIGTSPLVITLNFQQLLGSEFFSSESISISIVPNGQNEIGFKYSPQNVGVHAAQFITITNDSKMQIIPFSMGGSATTTVSVSKKILIDVFHKPLINLRDSLTGIVPLLSSLTKSGIGVTFADTSFDPIGFDLVLIMQPQAAFTQTEITALSKFVTNGGTALLLGDSSFEGSNNLLNVLLSDPIWKTVDTSGVGISLQRDVVIDSVNNFAKIPANILLTSFTDPKHPYFGNIDSLVFFGSVSLNVSGKAQPLIVSKGKSFNGNIFSDKLNPVVGAVQQIGKGRVLVFGDADQWRNLSAFDNLAFASNIFSVTENYSAKLPDKTPVEQYRMISIPFDLNATDIKTVLKDIGNPGPYTWRLFGRWNNTIRSYREFPSAGFSDFTRGEAYWLITKESKELQFGSATVTPAKEFYPIKIGPGYSMIGNPFPYPVSWKKSKRDSTERILWKFNGTGFDSVSDVMEPFAGYFVKSVAKDSITLYINPSDGKSLGKESSPQSSFAANEWNVNIKASSGKASDNFNIAGVSTTANDEWDMLDVSEPPPSPTDYLILTFNRASWKNNPGSYAMDIRPVHDEGNYWDFTVTSASKGSKVKLNLERVGNLPAEYSLYLIDNRTERAYSVSSIPDYTFAMSSSELQRSFRLIAGKKEYIEKNTNGIPLVPTEFVLEQNFPNPFNPTTNIRYSMGHSAEVSLNIYNILGQKVRTLTNDFHSIGSYELQWNGRNDAGLPVASGVYFYRITARASGEQIFTESKKLVLMK